MSQDENHLHVLSNYVGTWDVSSTMDGGASATGEVTAKWILGEKFVQGTGSVKTSDGSNDFEVTTIMAYDPFKNVYRTWSFLSNGMVTETEGTWNAETRTMTKVTHYGDVAQTTTSSFAEQGVERWTMVNTDKDGNVISEMHGTNVRR